MEVVDLPASASLRLKRAEVQEREPVRMVLTGHQFARTLALAFSPAAAYEAPMIQEKAQQVEVRVAQMTPQREVTGHCSCRGQRRYQGDDQATRNGGST